MGLSIYIKFSLHQQFWTNVLYFPFTNYLRYLYADMYAELLCSLKLIAVFEN